ncbi:hypothetical protein DB346_07650 [Verrucomicrobia bacterium LW23]|nr:hypothetical protein DB346_07650 [Verrucomicrobia bacterium LW23]
MNETSTPSSTTMLPEIITRIFDRYGPTAAFLAVTLVGLYLVYTDLQAQNQKLLAAFVEQAQAAQKMAGSVEMLARAVEANTAEMRLRMPPMSAEAKRL